MKFKIFALMALLFMYGCDSETKLVSEGGVVDKPVTEEPDTEKPIAEEPDIKVSSGWYMRTIAKATLPDGSSYIHKTAGIFGELKESQIGKDRNDISGFGTAILQVLFPQTQWAEDNGDYFSDYRALSAENAKKVWTFKVKNQRDVNLADAQLTLTLEGPYDVTSTDQNGRTVYEEVLSKNTGKKTSITLIDVDNQTAYGYEALKTLQLNMDGLHTRTFKWVLGTVTPDDYVSVSTIDTLYSTKSAPASNSKFGLPPQ